MYLVEFENNEVKKTSVALSLLTQNQDELAENPLVEFLNTVQSDNANVLKKAILPNELSIFEKECQTLFLTADNTLDDIDELLKEFYFFDFIFFVKDFKDGRTFSLIRHLKKSKEFLGDVYVLGNYGLDQAGYYYKSGATGFFVKDEQLDTILKTLDDLKSGHFGTSVNKLPMFQ